MSLLRGVVEKGHRGLGNRLFEKAPIVLSVGVTPGYIGAVEVSKQEDVVISVVCYQFGEPEQGIFYFAAWSPVCVDNCDGIGAVLWLEFGDDVLLLSFVNICCVELIAVC